MTRRIREGNNLFEGHLILLWEVMEFKKKIFKGRANRCSFVSKPLEKGTATHSGILAWEIPWTEESGGLQFMGSQRVRHDWVTNPFTFHENINIIGKMIFLVCFPPAWLLHSYLQNDLKKIQFSTITYNASYRGFGLFYRYFFLSWLSLPLFLAGW